jgi:hypothetical protein
MGAFADYVHSKGMKFGFWMPFHQIFKTSKVYKEHPEWQRGVGTNPYHLNYALPEVQQWIKDTFTQKIADYKLDWIKTDWKAFGQVAGDPDTEYEQVKGFYPHPIPDRAAARHPLAFSNVIRIREVRWHQNKNIIHCWSIC